MVQFPKQLKDSLGIEFSQGTPTRKKAGPFLMNRCYYMDSMEALSMLPYHSIDTCLTDPPFNVEYKGQGGDIKEFQVEYHDNMEKYHEWCFTWFAELQRITNGQAISPGNPNVFEWIRHEEPVDMAFHYKKNGHGVGRCYYLTKHDTILLYGKFNGRLRQSVLEHHLLNGFLRQHEWKHPCPSIDSLYIDILASLKPASVIDIFMGSGTTAQGAETLGIPWIGFELSTEYKGDIEKRIWIGIAERKRLKRISASQASLDSFL